MQQSVTASEAAHGEWRKPVQNFSACREHQSQKEGSALVPMCALMSDNSLFSNDETNEVTILPILVSFLTKQ